MRLTDFDVLTFDCYGTLIDWETGIFDALAPWLERHGVAIGAGAVLEAFARLEYLWKLSRFPAPGKEGNVRATGTDKYCVES